MTQQKSEIYFRFVSNGVGVFAAGKRYMPPELTQEYAAIKRRAAALGFIKPALPKDEAISYRFFFTSLGRDLFEKLYLSFFARYLEPIQMYSINEETLGLVVHRDDFQVSELVGYPRATRVWGSIEGVSSAVRNLP